MNKLLKVFEIIKEKRVNVKLLIKILSMTQEDNIRLITYNAQNKDTNYNLTLEEFKTIKEELL